MERLDGTFAAKHRVFNRTEMHDPPLSAFLAQRECPTIVGYESGLYQAVRHTVLASGIRPLYLSELMVRRWCGAP